MKRYTNILLDKTAKIVLCDPKNKQLFMDMILLLVGRKVADLKFLNIEQHGLADSDKSVNFDLLCQAADTGELFIVEIQNRSQDSFADRMLSYATYPIRRQLAQKEELLRQAAEGLIDERELDRMDYSLYPLYVLCIVNFAMPHETEDSLEDGLVSRYSIRNDASGELMTHALHFVFLELGRLKQRNGESAQCGSLLQQFAYSWRYMHLQEGIPVTFKDPLVQGLYRAAEYANLTIEQQQLYDKIMTTELDIIAQNRRAFKDGETAGLEKGLRKGEEKGLRKGMKLGKAKGKITTAKRLIVAMGLNPEEVAKELGVSPEELQ